VVGRTQGQPLAFTNRRLRPAERRHLGARAKSIRRTGKRGLSATLAIGTAVIALLWGLTVLASDAPLAVISWFWLGVGILIVVLTRRSQRSDERQGADIAAALESALRRDLAEVYDIRARGFVEFDEIEDEGACYAFAVAENRLLFLQGQEFYPAARFPSLDFSLVFPLAENGDRVDMMFDKRGPTARPDRVIPARVKIRLALPDDLMVVTGTLSDIERRFAA
jgi:hypothetical protein